MLLVFFMIFMKKIENLYQYDYVAEASLGWDLDDMCEVFAKFYEELYKECLEDNAAPDEGVNTTFEAEVTIEEVVAAFVLKGVRLVLTMGLWPKCCKRATRAFTKPWPCSSQVC